MSRSGYSDVFARATEAGVGFKWPFGANLIVKQLQKKQEGKLDAVNA